MNKDSTYIANGVFYKFVRRSNRSQTKCTALVEIPLCLDDLKYTAERIRVCVCDIIFASFFSISTSFRSYLQISEKNTKWFV